MEDKLKEFGKLKTTPKQKKEIEQMAQELADNLNRNVAKEQKREMNERLELTMKYPAKIIEYEDYNEDEMLECPLCHWKGTSEGNVEYYHDLFDVSCPKCDKMLLIVSYPLVKRSE